MTEYYDTIKANALITQLRTTINGLENGQVLLERKLEDMRTDLAAVKEDYATALRRERSVYNQKTRNYKKLKIAKADLERYKELENYVSHSPDCETETDGGDAKCTCGLEQSLNPKEIE